VLSTLAAHPAAPVSRADLIRDVWGTRYEGGSNTVDVVIRSLRRKLGTVADRIETVRGVGYRLR
jgi:DNA-binding response OmpR family regulator